MFKHLMFKRGDKMNIKTILMITFTLFIVTACSGEEKVEFKGAFLGGTQGVTVDFEPFGVEEDGIFTIFDTESFPIEVTLRNKGEYEIETSDITVKLLGPAPEEFEGIASRELKNSGIIDKISELIPEGGEETLTFATDALYKSEVQGLADRDWLANLEYKYKTSVIVPEVCLKEDLADKRVCEVKEDKKFFVSGAPIIVSQVTQSTAGKGIMALTFKVTDVGGGDKVTKVGEEFSTTNKIGFSLDDSAWVCSAAGKVDEARLRNGEATILCKLKEPLQEDDLFTKQVTLTLEYLYRNVVRETVRIKESSN
jgi:hypothetical protein